MKEKLIQELKKIEKNENKLKKYIRQGILFGSRKWGVADEDSDYDIMLNLESSKNIIDLCNELELKYEILNGSSISEYNRMYNIYNIKFYFNDTLYNVVGYTDEQLEVINEHILPKMDKIPKDILKSKDVRVMIFNGFLDIYFSDKYEYVNIKRKLHPLPIIKLDEDEIPF